MKNLRYLHAITFILSMLAISSAHADFRRYTQEETDKQNQARLAKAYEPSPYTVQQIRNLHMIGVTSWETSDATLAGSTRKWKLNEAGGLVAPEGLPNDIWGNLLSKYRADEAWDRGTVEAANIKSYLTALASAAKAKEAVKEQEERKLVLGAELPKTIVTQQIKGESKGCSSRCAPGVMCATVCLPNTSSVEFKKKIDGVVAAAIGAAAIAGKSVVTRAPAATTPVVNPYSDPKVQAYLRAVAAQNAAQTERTLSLGGR